MKPIRDQGRTCHCGQPAVVNLLMTTPEHQYHVGEWWLCYAHAWGAIQGAELDVDPDDIDFADDE